MEKQNCYLIFHLIFFMKGFHNLKMIDLPH